MPTTKSAKKKMRKDKKRTVRNRLYKKNYKEILKKIKKGEKNLPDLLAKFYSLVDKAAKKNIIHKNKAARLKSRVSRLGKKTT